VNRTTRENAKSVYSTIFDGQYPAKHRVLILWRAEGFTELEHRSAAFEEYFDAQTYAKSLCDKYLSLNLPFTVYLDREVFFHTQEPVFTYD